MIYLDHNATSPLRPEALAAMQRALEIGGTVDANLSVIIDPITGDPYLPGSSLKGKLRSIVEEAGAMDVSERLFAFRSTRH